MLYKLYVPLHWEGYKPTPEKKEKELKEISLIIKYLQEVLGYTTEECEEIRKNKFDFDIARHLTIEQAELIMQPFYDHDIKVYLEKNVETSSVLIPYNEVGFIKRTPKEHYYDEPVVGREHLTNPFITPHPLPMKYNVFENTNNSKPKCPYCQSTNIKKISTINRMVSTGLFGFGSGKVGKQWHCNNCSSDF